MRFVEEHDHKNNTTRVARLIISRKRDHSIRVVEIVETRNTKWYPSLYTYEDTTYKPSRMKK